MNAPSKAEWVKPRAADIAAQASLGDEATRLLSEGLAPGPFLDLLLCRALYADALRIFAHGLPVRQAVWWGCLCVSRAGLALTQDQQALVKAVARWAIEPSEPRRKAVEECMGADPLEHLAGRLAFAVTVTGSRIPYPDSPAVPPQPELAPRAIKGAVLGAAADSNRPNVDREFAAIGIHVLEGRYGVDVLV
jgi:hypothetical protein